MASPKRQSAQTTSVPAPIGGWNGRDSLANMPPTDAVQLINWYPTPTDVMMRKGWTQVSILTTTTGVKTISSITHVGLVATVTTASAHGLVTGQQISVSGATPSDYNGVYKITQLTPTTLSYTMSTIPSGNASVVGVYAIGLTTPINTLMDYPKPGGGYSLFAAAGTNIYDAKPNPATLAFSGITSDKFQSVNFSNAAGDFIVACNGVDPTMVYDGSTWYFLATTSTAQTISSITHVGNVATVTTASPHGLVTNNKIVITGATANDYNGSFNITVTGASTFTYTMATTPAGNASVVGTYTVYGITGVNSSRFVNVNLFKNRLYFVEKDTLTAWYLDVNAIAGVAAPLYFGGIARNGGELQAMGTWTLDAGQGADDYAVWITTMGETIVYNGTDPTDPTAWALKGVWQLGQTFNRRCFYKWAGDLLLLTQDGLVPLSSALQSSRLDPRVNLTDKIYYPISIATSQYYNNFGWQINYHATENMLILSIPVTGGMEQYVMHTISKAWARFTGIQAYCWQVSGDADMHFGGDGVVGTLFTSLSDNGNNINAKAQQAYSYFGSMGQQKRFTMVRPILQSTGGVPAILCGLNVDFDSNVSLGSVSFNQLSVKEGIWDSGTWDNCNWEGGLITNKVWQSVTGIGYSGSVNMNAVAQGIELHWASTDFVMEVGGVL